MGKAFVAVAQTLLFWQCNLEVAADFACEKFLDLFVPGYSGSCTLLRVEEYRVFGSFAKKLAAMLDEMPLKLSPLHTRGSHYHGDRLPPRGSSALLQRELPIGFKNELKRFSQIAPRLG